MGRTGMDGSVPAKAPSPASLRDGRPRETLRTPIPFARGRAIHRKFNINADAEQKAMSVAWDIGCWNFSCSTQGNELRQTVISASCN